MGEKRKGFAEIWSNMPCWNGNCPQINCGMAHLRPPPPQIHVPKIDTTKMYNLRLASRQQEKTKVEKPRRRRSRSTNGSDRSSEVQDSRTKLVNEGGKGHTTDRLQYLQPIYGNPQRNIATGLKNLNNTCYMNAVVQCLSQVGIVAAKLGNMKTKKGTLVDEMRFLMMAINSGDLKRISPVEFKKAVDLNLKYFAGNKQHDAHDFMFHLIEQMETDTANEMKMLDLFKGKTQSKITCNGCKDLVLSAEEPFNSLHLKVFEDDPSAMKSIKALMRAVAVKHRCEKCDGEKATQEMKFKKLPEVLALHVRRFGQDENGWPIKNHSTFKYPLNLQFEKTMYNLQAGIYHSGGISGGHYVAKCLQATTGKWFCFNDDAVNEVNMQSEMQSRQVYVLVYVKKENNAMDVEAYEKRSEKRISQENLSNEEPKQNDTRNSLVDAVKNRERKKNSKYVEDISNEKSQNTTNEHMKGDDRKEENDQEEKEKPMENGNSPKEDITENIQDKNKQLVDLNEKIKMLSKENEKMKESIEKNRQEKEKAEAIHKKTNNVMEVKNNDIQDLRRKISDMTDKRKIDKQTMESLRKEMKEKKKEIQEKEREKEEFRKRAEKMESELSKVEKEWENKQNDWS